MNTPIIRGILAVIMFFVVVVMPWWISLPLLVILTFYFDFYLEVVFFGFLFDSIYAIQYDLIYSFLNFATVVLLVSLYVKTRIRR
ncbi:MAG: hypothetical protein ABL917_02120 [Parcubacteria group bacterium]